MTCSRAAAAWHGGRRTLGLVELVASESAMDPAGSESGLFVDCLDVPFVLGPTGRPSVGRCKAVVPCSALVGVLCVGVGVAWGGGRPWLSRAWRRVALRVRQAGLVFFRLGHRAAVAMQPASGCGAGECVLLACLSCGSRCSLLLALPCLLVCIACMLRTWWLECSWVVAGDGCWRWSRRASATAQHNGWCLPASPV